MVWWGKRECVGVGLPAGRETWERSQTGGLAKRLLWTLEASRLKYSERVRRLSGMVSTALILG
jgi:hypothetical protein